MSNENNRVLIRKGARPLTENELQEISGGKITLASVLGTGPVSNPDEILTNSCRHNNGKCKLRKRGPHAGASVFTRDKLLLQIFADQRRLKQFSREFRE